MRTIILIWLLALIYCLLVSPAYAGTNFTNLSSVITYPDTNTYLHGTLKSSSPISKEEKDFRMKLVEKINAIQEQFEEARRVSQASLSKERINEIEQQAIKVLNGAMVICKSEVIE